MTFTGEERRASEELFQNILDAIGDIVFVKGPGSRLLWGNKALLSYYGMTQEQLAGIIDAPFVEPDLTQQYLRDDQYVFSSGERLDIPEEPITRFDGEVRTFHTTKSPVFDSNGRVVLLVGRSTDITDRKKMEESLGAIVREREALFESEQEARAAAEKANQVTDGFLAMLSHELRTPLSTILAWTQLLRAGKLTAEETMRGLEILEQSAQTQGRLIDDLLDISRIRAGKLNLNIEEFDPAKVIADAIDSTRSLADSKSVTIETTILPAVKRISADPVRFQQILWNLITNAIRFSPQGATIWNVLDRIESPSGGQIRLQVRDNGIGIKPESIPLIFEAFTQLDGTSTRTYGGLGLGLAITRNLVELHGGTIIAESPGEGKGTTFVVCIPARISATANVAETENEAERHASVDLHGLRILLVDDEENSRDVFAVMLRSFGAEVMAAASARQCLEVISEFRPDVLISDIAMPLEDGYALISKIRMLENDLSQTPAVALTAHAGLEDVRRVHMAGFQTHLAKPVAANTLAQAIARLAGRNASSSRR
ncbi:MAG TPA: ATP-binding protein [Nitrospira sp.]|nr:ATP-binding protein [Nitrospira sp.]